MNYELVGCWRLALAVGGFWLLGPVARGQGPKKRFFRFFESGCFLFFLRAPLARGGETEAAVSVQAHEALLHKTSSWKSCSRPLFLFLGAQVGGICPRKDQNSHLGFCGSAPVGSLVVDGQLVGSYARWIYMKADRYQI